VVEKASKEVGEIDIVVVNAGVSMWKDHIDCTDGVFPLHLVIMLIVQRISILSSRSTSLLLSTYPDL
jgi:hypothetical protein